jgi:predicted ATPase
MPTKPKLRLSVQNFRSVMNGDIDLKPITILTGANGAGKSTFMHALMVLRNLGANANQPMDSFFNLGFANLGGFKEVVTRKDTNKTIQFGFSFIDDKNEATYSVGIGPSSFFRIAVKRPFVLDLRIGVSFPYPMVQNATQEITWNNERFKFTFNGIGLTVLTAEGNQLSVPLDKQLYTPVALPMTIPGLSEYVDVKRGFFRNTYAPLGAAQTGEDEIASLLGSDRDLEAKVSLVLDKMMGKSFAARHTALGAASFYLQTTDRETGFVCDLVNEGFGVNQLVYLLAKSLRKDHWLVCIEEPETHLHPEAQSKLAEQLLRITKTDSKRFLIASHSEHFVASLLNLVARQKATPDDLGIYFVAKDENNLTQVAEQRVNEKGQIEGGLKSFYEPSIRALEEFLGSESNKEHVNPSK